MKKISRIAMLGTLYFLNGCYTDGSNDFKSGGSRSCQSAPPYILEGKIMDTDWSHDAIDGNSFSFTINTQRYGNRRIETSPSLRDRIITGDSIRVLLNRCVDINNRVFGVSERSLIIKN